MKTLARLTAVFVLFVTACAQPAPEEPTFKTINLDFDLLVVRLPEEAALPLIPQLRERKEAAAATRKILELVAAKKAVLLGWPLLTTKSGQRAVAEQIDEVRYATGFNPTSHMTVTTTHPSGRTAQGPPAPDPITGKVTTSVLVHDGLPDSFETRNVGVTLEIESVLAPDGKAIDISVVPQHIRLLGYRKVEVEQKDSGRKVVVEQPDFLTHKVTTSLTVLDGDHTLLGVFKVNDPPGQIELFILHSQVRLIDLGVSSQPEAAPTPR